MKEQNPLYWLDFDREVEAEETANNITAINTALIDVQDAARYHETADEPMTHSWDDLDAEHIQQTPMDVEWRAMVLRGAIRERERLTRTGNAYQQGGLIYDAAKEVKHHADTE